MSSSQNSANNSGHLRGYIYIASATFLWAVSANLGRAVFTGRLLPNAKYLQTIDPVILSQARASFSFLIFFGVMLISWGWRRLQVPRADVGRLFLLGIFGLVGSNYLYYLAIQRTNVATAIIVQYSAPVWVLLYMAARGAQKLVWQRVAAVALSVCGIVLVVGFFGAGRLQQDKIGLLAALLAAFSFALNNIGGHNILKRFDHWIVLLYITWSATIFWLFVNPPWKIFASHYTAGHWLFLIVFSVLSMLIPYSLYIAGLQYLDPTRAVVVSCLEPVFSIAIAALVLKEVVRPLQMLGIVLVLVAIVVVQLPDGTSSEIMQVEPTK